MVTRDRAGAGLWRAWSVLAVGAGRFGGEWNVISRNGSGFAAESGSVLVVPGNRFTGNCIWGVGKNGEYYVYSHSSALLRWPR